MNLTRSAVLIACLLASACSASRTPPADAAEDDAAVDTATLTGSVDLPGGSGGLSFDDLRYSARLHRVVVPAAQSGAVDLIDPDTLAVTHLGGLGSLHDVESADEGRGVVFAVDRGAAVLGAIDPVSGQVLATAPITGGADYVRYVEPTSEVWVTQAGRIQVFSVAPTGTPTLTPTVFVTVANGVEGLAIDVSHRRAYVHLFGARVAAIDVDQHVVVTSYPMNCGSVHGIPAVDEARGLLFAGCGAAEVEVLDLNHDGALLGHQSLASGTTILAYAPQLGHFYLRGDPGTDDEVLGVSSAGALTVLGTVQSANGGHCATADDAGHFWICDASNGRVLRYRDPYPATLQ